MLYEVITVVVGSRLRAHTVPIEVTRVGECGQIIYRMTIEIEGKDKPACVAEFIRNNFV